MENTHISQQANSFTISAKIVAIVAAAGLAVSATVLLMKSRADKQKIRKRKNEESSDSEGDTT